jgi:hypothetical protein
VFYFQDFYIFSTKSVNFCNLIIDTLMTGYACSYLCNYCHFEEVFMQGPGFQVKPQTFNEYISGNHKLFHYKIHDKIVSMVSSYPEMIISASFQVYKCPQCRTLHNKTRVNIYSGEQVLHRNVFKCCQCKRRLKPTNVNRLKKATCPVCMKSSFKRQKIKDLLW